MLDEKLTQIDGVGENQIIKCFDCGTEKSGEKLEHCGYCEHWQEVVNRLAAYEKKKAAGLLVELPYKIENKIYITGEKHVLQQEELDAIQVRLEAATPWPWTSRHTKLSVQVEEKYFSHMRIHNTEEPQWRVGCIDAGTSADLNFITNAPMDIQNLLNHINAIQVESAALRSALGENADWAIEVIKLRKEIVLTHLSHNQMTANRDYCSEEVDKLRKKLTNLTNELTQMKVHAEALEAFIRSGKEIGCLSCKYYKTTSTTCDECRKKWPCNWDFDETKFAKDS